MINIDEDEVWKLLPYNFYIRYQDDPNSFQESPLRLHDNRYQNGDQDRTINHSNSFTLSQQYLQQVRSDLNM